MRVNDRLTVLKVGGSRGIDLPGFCEDLSGWIKGGQKVILVHGGSYETNLLSERLGKPPRFVTSVSGYESRYTDRETLEIFEMVYAGKVNKRIVELLQKFEINAVGLSGLDGRIFEGKRKPFIKIIEGGRKKLLKGDYTGRVERINKGLLNMLLEAGYTPVITPPGISYEGEAINVDGDRAAAMLAAAMGAEQLIIFSNVPGLLRDLNDESSLIREIRKEEARDYLDFAQGRMKKKLLGAIEALENGVKSIVFADGRAKEPIKKASRGEGTVIR